MKFEGDPNKPKPKPKSQNANELVPGLAHAESSYASPHASSGESITLDIEGAYHNQLEQLDSFEYTVDDLVDVILSWTQTVFGSAEVVAAKNQFFNETGSVFSEEAFYDARLSYFFNYFTFSQTLMPTAKSFGFAVTPYDAFLASDHFRNANISEQLNQDFERLGRFSHSLFKILKSHEDNLVVRDVFSGQKHQVISKGRLTFFGFSKGDLIQTYLFALEERRHFSRGYFVHPHKANSVVLKYAKKVKRSSDFDKIKALKKLAHVQLDQLRHKHIDSKKFFVQKLFP